MKHRSLIAQFVDIFGLLSLLASVFAPLYPKMASNGTVFVSLFEHFGLFNAEGDSLRLVTGILLYLVFIYVLWRLLSIFLSGKLGSFGPSDRSPAHGFRIVAVSFVLFAGIFALIGLIKSTAEITEIPALCFILGGLLIALHIYSTIGLSSRMGSRDPDFYEYKNSELSAKSISKGMIKISSKLILLFVLIIAVIGSVLTLNFAWSYRTSIVKSVADSALNQVDQAASTYKLNLEDSLGIVDFVKNQNTLNKKATYPFEKFIFYTLDRKQVLIKENPDSQFYSEFKPEYSTEKPDQQFPEGPVLDPKKVELWIKAGTGVEEYDETTAMYLFASPITVKDKGTGAEKTANKTRILGFAVVSFKESVILEPYNLGLLSVLLLTFFFLYLGVVAVYLAGNFLITPLLFLRMSVQTTSDILGKMIKGHERVAATSLTWKDKVKSKDEIKALSGDFGDMVTVIRGIIPYISASTLKQAQTGTALSEKKELAFLFTDIRGFTTLCEGLSPDEVVNVLNRYLDLETEIILECGGDVDKFVGDEMMAFFDGPEKEINACRAAMKIIKAMDEEATMRRSNGLPVVEIGIGINSGEVVFGSVGARERMDFTSIGDAVNLAARLEGANKAYGSRSLISQTVYNKVRSQFLCREVDLIAVKGKEKPVGVYELLFEGNQFTQKEKELTVGFQKGLLSYRERDWGKALAYFKLLSERYADKPALSYIERIEHFKKSPPADNWDGVFRMTVK